MSCPPGYICIGLTGAVGILVGMLLLFYVLINSRESTPYTPPSPSPTYRPLPVQTNMSIPRDTLLNPYTPPLRLTVGNDMTYHQVGLLKSESGPSIVIPLMARVVNRKRSMWKYYTLHDKNTLVKLPVVSRGKSCTAEYGCDELSTGESVVVEGYDPPFKVSLYDNMY